MGSSKAPFSLPINLFRFALIAVFATCISAAPVPAASSPAPTPTPTPNFPPVLLPPTPMPTRCPRDAIKLSVCLNLLGGLINVNIGHSAQHCCPLLVGLADLEIAVCLCTAIKANLLGAPLNIPILLTLPITCGQKIPDGFKCI